MAHVQATNVVSGRPAPSCTRLPPATPCMRTTSQRNSSRGSWITAATQVAEQPLTWSDIEQHAGTAFLEGGYAVRRGQRPGTAPHPTLPTQLEVHSDKPVVLYRDTNAWCPFCERVWMALLEKRIPFDVIFIELFDKPDWYERIVPTKLVPALRLTSSGDVICESYDILKRLDEEFPERPLVPQDAELLAEAEALIEAERPLSSAGYRFLTTVGEGGFRGQKSPDRLPEFRAEFEELLGGLETSLGKHGGPFLLGKEVSYVDTIYVPALERFAANMSFVRGFHLRGNPAYPNLSAWFDAINALPSYQQVKTDDGTHHMLVDKFFGVEDRAAQEVDDTVVAARREAAAKLNINREVVLADIVARSGAAQSTQSINGYPGEAAAEVKEAVDFAVRRLGNYLLTGKPGPKHPEAVGRAVGAASLAYWRNRASSPRDMTAAAAEQMRLGCDAVLKETY